MTTGARRSGFSAMLALVCLASLGAGPAREQESEPYRFTIAGVPVAEGELWLYYYGWGYVERRRLGDVRRGETEIRPTAEALVGDAEIPENVEAVLVALHVPGVGWYEILDVGHRPGPTTPMPPLPTGQVPLAPGGPVDLPAPVRQELRLLNPDGSPRAGQTMTVEIFLSRENHCGVHRTFEGTDARFELTTDADGVAEFTAPLSAIWLAAPFYSERGGPLGRQLTREPGVRLPVSTRHAIQRIWDREPVRTFSIRVQRPDGSPATSAHLWVNESIYACGVTWSPAGAADAGGEIVASFAPEHQAMIWIADEDGGLDGREVLTEPQLEELYRTGALTIVWHGRRDRP